MSIYEVVIERFPDADTIIVGNFHDTLRCLDFTGNEYVVILTRSHQYFCRAVSVRNKKSTSGQQPDTPDINYYRKEVTDNESLQRQGA